MENNTKKIIVLILAVFLMLNIQTVYAQDDEEDSPGRVTPDSIFYGLDRAFERVSLAFKFSKTAKAQKGLEMAQERLMEAKVMAEENKFESALRAQTGHEEAIKITRDAIENIEDDANANEAKEAIREVAKIQNRTESHYQKVSEVKDAILERQRERMSEEQIAKLEEVFNKIKEKAKEMEMKSLEKKENAKNNYKRLSGKSDNEIEEEIETIDEDTGLAKGREKRAEEEIKKAEEALVRARGNIAKEKELGTNVTDIEDIFMQAQEQIQNAKEQKIKEKNKDAKDIAEEVKDFGNEVSALATQLGQARAEGNFEAIFNQMKETIRERHIYHMENIETKIPEQEREKIKATIEETQKEIIKEQEKTSQQKGR